MADVCGKPDSGGRFWLTNHADGSFATRGEDRLLEMVLAAEVSLGESVGMAPELILDSDRHLWRTS